MEIKLKHPSIKGYGSKFKDRLLELFAVDNFNDFEKRLQETAKQHDVYGYYTTDSSDGSNKIKGDIFEIFIECLIKLSPVDNRIGISDYECIPITEDTGVDGKGKGINGNPATIQIKYRTNPTDELIAKNLNQFTFQSQNRYGVKLEDDKNMFVFTTCQGLHYHTQEVMTMNKVVVRNKKFIQNIVDGNCLFWKQCIYLLERC